MYVFTTYVAAWLPDILVESSTGTRPNVTGLFDVPRTSAVRWVTTRELPLGFIKATRCTVCALVFCVRMFLGVVHALVFCVILFRVWYLLSYSVFHFSKSGTRSGILCRIYLCVEHTLVFCVIYFQRVERALLYYVFLCVERALVFCVLFFHVRNALWYFVLYFMCVERTLVFCVTFFRVWNAIWFFVLYVFLIFSLFHVVLYLLFLPLSFSFLPVWNYLWFVRFGIVEFCIIIFCLAFLLWNLLLYFSVCEQRSGIMELCVIFFRIWNGLWYCRILCYIFPRLECALVLWNFVLHFSACETRFGIVELFVVFFPCVTCFGSVEFRVMFSRMCNAIWFCGICLVFFSV